MYGDVESFHVGAEGNYVVMNVITEDGQRESISVSKAELKFMLDAQPHYDDPPVRQVATPKKRND